MECKKYWEILEVSTLDRAKIEKTRQKLEDHIETCELCKNKFSKVEEYDNKTKNEMGNIPIPEDLKSKIKLNLVDVKLRNSYRNKNLFITGFFLLLVIILWIII